MSWKGLRMHRLLEFDPVISGELSPLIILLKMFAT